MMPGFVRKSPLIAALVFIGCGKDSSGPVAVPSTVAVAPNAVTTATVGTVVTPALTFSVKDQNGASMAGVPVTITVTGGGTVASPATTTTSGETSIGVWTLGTLVGVNTVTIKAGNLAPITFSITTVAGPPAQIVTVSGGGQTGLAGSTLAPLTLKVADQFGNGVANRPVTIAVAEGGGAVTPSTGTTDASGQITGVVWTLGKSALPQTLSVGSGTIVNSIPALVQTSYNLEVRYFGGDPTTAVQAAFTNAAARIKGAVVGTLGTVQFTNVALGDPAQPNTNCGVTGVTLNELVRDVIIFAQIKPIDGPGKILGSAGPCLVRNTSRLTIIGVMQFDSDDLAALAVPNGTGPTRLEQVILHEMSHVVGFGTLWGEKTPSQIAGEGGADPRFIGPKSTAECTIAGGTTLCANGVAVENCTGIPNCGAGTQDSHWREGSGTTIAGFKTELMTGFISNGVVNPYSNITIQSFADLGYTVNSLAADTYTVPSPSLRALLQLDGASLNILQGETVRLPQAMVSHSGVITRLERQ
jgi:hypothetical protein